MNSFAQWWQYLPHHIDPVIFQVGSFRLQYYGLMYLAAFGLTYLLALYRIKKETRWTLDNDHLQGMLTAMIIGLIVGARLGYVIFYQPAYYASRPLEIFLPFGFDNGFHFTGISGMSYHGGLIGTTIGMAWYVRKYRLGFREMVDLLAPCIPAGYTFGRIGNFINGELWGRITTSPVGMYFPHAPGNFPRHPSQLYEAFGEGVLLFVVLWALRKRIQTPGAMLAFYLIGYGSVRFVIEFFREPDAHLGFILFFFSMGQLLCMAMIAAGVILYGVFRRMAYKSIK
ncbi:prolipoprotein diacylglyceryl transferase [Desulfatitalea alkaliphila]|uniref:Phosphatidylglycerol--prolipoprotein diacylglyceryl transferase n=1 Tax=Desulfatitalea alkaliphila TaxID=2929485 RepID=A0AA41R4C1_9BACT|nr:prolipoprotein diacylglyceryl transferase [Desulfatitalea alkaliphila]MCJ8500630.1 prolipoprotein diacylglyceryl transferase [Desulfatitalea alkaliphila]